MIGEFHKVVKTSKTTKVAQLVMQMFHFQINPRPTDVPVPSRRTPSKVPHPPKERPTPPQTPSLSLLDSLPKLHPDMASDPFDDDVMS